MKRKFLGIFLSMLLLLQIGIIPAYAVEIADDFTSYTTTADLANSFSKATNDNITQISLASPENSPYGNALKISETVPANTTAAWRQVDWNVIPSSGLSGAFQINFSVYIEDAACRRDFSIFDGTAPISFITFYPTTKEKNYIKRINEDRSNLGQSSSDFDPVAEYETKTWYNVEFTYNVTTYAYSVVVRKADDNELIASDSRTLSHSALEKITCIDGIGFKSYYALNATNEVSSSVYIDNLSIKDITGSNISDKTFADDFSGYANTDALSSAFSNADISSGDENTVTQMSLETLSDSTYGNVLKITESSDYATNTWYPVTWNAVSGAGLSGLIKASFSVYIDGKEHSFREFAIKDGSKELSFLAFRKGAIMRVDPAKPGEARTEFTTPAVYENNTWYDAEFEYNLNTGEYYVAVRKAEDDSLIAEDRLTLVESIRPAITQVNSFEIQNRIPDADVTTSPAVYIDNLSIENISEPEIEGFYVTPIAYTAGTTGKGLSALTDGEVASWVPVVAADGVTGINLKAYLALYKDGCLDDVKILPITTAGEHHVEFDEAITLAEGSRYMLRTYVWSGDTLIPMVADAGISN